LHPVGLYLVGSGHGRWLGGGADRQYPANHIRYIEAESAFDLPYARSMGLPEGVEMVSAVRTVEELSNDLKTFLEGANGNTPYLYILDSLDALSDEAEMDRDIGDGTYGTGKAKMMSQLFRRQVNMLETKHCTFIVISQIRDKIGVSFGCRRFKRSNAR
jgi:recombination protein RecA